MRPHEISNSDIRHSIFSVSTYRLFGNAKYLSILLVLLAAGYVGYATHGSFGLSKYSQQESEIDSRHNTSTTEAKTTEAKPVFEVCEVRFASKRSLNHSEVSTSPIEQRSIQERVKATGVITYDERTSASLSARASGTVWRVIKQPGNAVCLGDVLTIIDAVEVGRAKAEFLSDLVSVESKSEILDSLEKVSGAVSQRQVREARVASRQARIQLKNSEQTLTNLGLSVRHEDFKTLTDEERAAKMQFLGLPESITKNLDPVQTTSNLLPVTAPFDGVLLHHNIALGEMVEAGKSLLEVADLRRMWLKLDVQSEQAAKLEIGQKVDFRPDGLQSELESAIVWISTEMNEKTRTLSIRAEVDNPVITSDTATGQEIRLLRANMFGTGTIMLRESVSAFVVPVSAILFTDSQPMIIVRIGELSFTGFDVKLGVREQDLVQIESDNLTPGMECVSQIGDVLKSEWFLNQAAPTP